MSTVMGEYINRNYNQSCETLMGSIDEGCDETKSTH